VYRDNSLVPSEAIRLLALGILATKPASYAALASSVRDFSSHVVGPSLELIGTPIELLKVEGLVEGEAGPDDPETAELVITESGREELRRLLNANVRAPVTSINKLILALKVRFLHLLPPEEQKLQAAMLAEMCQRELTRLTQLRARHSDEPGHLTDWLDHDIEEVTTRFAWFERLCERIGQQSVTAD
jgi:DNA-binding PadR family transcriptional regulator